MKENEEDLNEVEEIGQCDDVEMTELSEEEENDVTGGASKGLDYSWWEFPSIYIGNNAFGKETIAIRTPDGSYAEEGVEINGWYFKGKILYRKYYATYKECMIGKIVKKRKKFYGAYQITARGLSKIMNVYDL